MTYTELKQIFDNTQLLPYSERIKGFSEGVHIISQYLASDFANTHCKVLSDYNGVQHFQMLYGDLDEMLPEMNFEDASRLAELGWSLPQNIEETFLTYVL